MASYNSIVLTTAGTQMLNSAISSGTKITFTKAQTSQTQYSQSQLTNLAVLSPTAQETVDLKYSNANSKQTKISITFTNKEVTTAYNANTVALFASNGTDEFLFAVATAKIAESVPAYDGTQAQSMVIDFYLALNAENATINVTNAGMVSGTQLADVQSKLSQSVDTVDKNAVHLGGTETILGDKNFIGKLQKNGVDVATTSDVATTQNSAINTANSYTDSSIKSIDIGGRNLLLGTATDIAWSAGSGRYSNKLIATGLKPNQTYTFSAEVTLGNTDQKVVGILLYNDSIKQGLYSADNFKADGTRDHWTFTVPSSVNTSTITLIIYAGTIGNTAGNTVTYHHTQLEVGTVPTDWTPAPEDKLDANANAASATKLATPRKIGGVAFDGTADINLPGVNATGNQNTTGLANAVQSLEITSGTDLSTIKGYGGSAVYHIAGGITLTSTPSDYSGKGAILKVTEANTTVYQELIDVMTDNGSWIRIISDSTVYDWKLRMVVG